jgi:hypothetical protein
MPRSEDSRGYRGVRTLRPPKCDAPVVKRRRFRTERNHMANIILQHGVHSQLQALVFAARLGVVEIR